jgi:hypothetical protein
MKLRRTSDGMTIEVADEKAERYGSDWVPADDAPPQDKPPAAKPTSKTKK